MVMNKHSYLSNVTRLTLVDLNNIKMYNVTVDKQYKNRRHIGKARQGKFICIAHFIHIGNSKCFT